MADLSYIQVKDGVATQAAADAEGGFMVSGLPRLAQRVMLELLTVQGSLRYWPARGTLFLVRLQTGLYTELDVLVAFSAARATLKANLQGEELPTDPPDERYADSAITNVTVGPGFVEMTLSITSRAGNSTTLALPVLVFTG